MLATWGCSTFPKPTLSLDFAGATSLDSGITFSRGSQATLFDSTGTLVYAKHNLLLYSQDFTDAAWTKNASSITSDATVSPDGTVTGDKLIEDATTAAHGIQSAAAPTTAIGAVYTVSVYAKKSERDFLQIFFTTGHVTGNPRANYDLSAGTLGTVDSGISAQILSVGNGWYRCVATVTAAASGLRPFFNLITSSSASRNASYAGDGTSGLFLWGAQLNFANMEGGVTSSLTTYYPTTTAAYYAPRFDYNPSTLQPLGLLIEEARTNSIRNNTMQGAVAGTPGTLPTNWTESLIGLTRQVVGTGTENGITYVDIRISGTTISQFGAFMFDATNQIAASSGQAWTESFYAKIVAGSTSGIGLIGVRLVFNDINGNFVAGTFPSITLTSSLTRFSGTGTAPASTAFVQPGLYFNGANASGNVIDITLRIGLPQLELGAFATSVIPTTTTALTRNADVASMTGTNFSSWYNQTEGTFFAEATSAWASGNIVGSSDGTNNNRIFLGIASGPASRLLITTLGSSVASITVPYTLNTVVKGAGAYKENSSQYAANGVLGVEDTVCTIPTVNRLSIGTNTTASDFFLNGYIRRLAFYPQRLPNATLQALTA